MCAFSYSTLFSTLFTKAADEYKIISTPPFAESVTEGDVKWNKGWELSPIKLQALLYELDGGLSPAMSHGRGLSFGEQQVGRESTFFAYWCTNRQFPKILVYPVLSIYVI